MIPVVVLAFHSFAMHARANQRSFVIPVRVLAIHPFGAPIAMTIYRRTTIFVPPLRQPLRLPLRLPLQLPLQLPLRLPLRHRLRLLQSRATMAFPATLTFCAFSKSSAIRSTENATCKNKHRRTKFACRSSVGTLSQPLSYFYSSPQYLVEQPQDECRRAHSYDDSGLLLVR